VALVGLGRWGSRLLSSLAQHPDYATPLLVDDEPEALRRAATLMPNAETLEQLDVALGRGLDAVLLATPSATHGALGAQSLRAGIPLFVEKPMATSYAEARHLVDLARQRGLALMTGHVLEHEPALELLTRLVSSGHLGEVLAIDAVRHGAARLQSDPWWTLAPHDLSLVRRLVANLRVIGVEPREPQTCVAHLRGDGRAAVTVSVCSASAHRRRKLTVRGTLGTLHWDQMGSPHTLQWRSAVDGRSEVLSVERHDALQRQLSAFARAVRFGTLEPGHGGAGLEVVRLLEEGERLRGVPVAAPTFRESDLNAAPAGSAPRHAVALRP